MMITSKLKGANRAVVLETLKEQKTLTVYSCETEPPIVGKVSHMWISEKR